jgi:hypothetical protein
VEKLSAASNKKNGQAAYLTGYYFSTEPLLIARTIISSTARLVFIK